MDAMHALESFLREHPDVDLIKFTFLFLSSVPGARYASKARAIQIAKAGGHAGLATHNSLSLGITALGGVIHKAVPGQEFLVPDWSTLRLSRYQENEAEVVCNIWRTAVEWSSCHRTISRNFISSFEKKYDSQVLVGFEIEFYLLESEASLKPVDMTKHALAEAPLRHSKGGAVLREAFRALEAEDIPVWAAASESGPAQLEISLAPQRAIDAADTLIRAMGLIKDVAAKHGVYATMAPSPAAGSTGSGLHMHLSISYPEGKETHFLAGLLKRMDEMTAVACAHPSSYLRAKSGWVSYSEAFPIAAIRRMRAGHWELRQPDATANPYLLIMSVLALGGKGIDEKAEIDISPRSKLVEHEQLAMSRKVRQELGVKKQLSGTLTDAVDAMAESLVLKEAFGEELFDWYIATKESDAKNATAMSPEALRSNASRLW